MVRKFETKRHAKLSKFVTNGGGSSVEMCASSASAHGRRETRKECQGGNAIKPESEKNQVLVIYIYTYIYICYILTKILISLLINSKPSLTGKLIA